MKQAYIHLIRSMIERGHTVSVWDGEEWQIKRSVNLRECCNAVKSVEEAQLRFRDSAGNKVGWALVSAYGLEPDETVIDCTDNPLIDEIMKPYF